MGEHPDLAAMRQSYTLAGLDESDLAGTWHEQFEIWLAQAVAAGVTEPNAMVVGTVDADGVVATRTVLAKGVSEAGIVFYTNYESAKSRALQANPVLSATFPWLTLQRQVHLRGVVERVDPATTEAYWRQRPRESQLGAWASPQSAPVADRAALAALLAAAEERFAGVEVPVPPHWGGWLLRPRTVEFWQGRVARLHDRLRFRRDDVTPGSSWTVERLAP